VDDEVHADPQHAMTDGAQSITPAGLEQMMPVLPRIAESIDREIPGTPVGV